MVCAEEDDHARHTCVRSCACPSRPGPATARQAPRELAARGRGGPPGPVRQTADRAPPRMTDAERLAHERAALVAELRTLAQRVEDCPVEHVGQAVDFIGRGVEDLRGRAAMVFGDRSNADPQQEPLETAEGAATVDVARRLPRHIALADETFNFVSAVVGRVSEVSGGALPLATQIVVVLLAKLGNDLRGVTRLALTGYPLQAAALATSAYETACAIALIGTDADRARQWREHEDPQRLPAFLRSLKDATVEMLRSLGMRDAQLDQQADHAYLAYANLCMAKHGNPRLLAEYGFVRRGAQTLWVPPGPIPMPEAERATVYAINTAVVVALWASTSVLGRHVPADRRADLKTRLDAIGRARLDVANYMTERGWDRDPWQQWELPSSKKRDGKKRKKK